MVRGSNVNIDKDGSPEGKHVTENEVLKICHIGVWEAQQNLLKGSMARKGTCRIPSVILCHKRQLETCTPQNTVYKNCAAEKNGTICRLTDGSGTRYLIHAFEILPVRSSRKKVK